MYVQNPYDRTYQPQKMSHTSLCVRVMRRFTSRVRDKASLFDVGACIPTVRACLNTRATC